ncbi:caspase-9 [Centrocercus urophasianus]|uniref:caspase-9 n=1 Tax=Centrocercus urophasianus TaxID=9002 RepID=UPI001C64C0E9|nr:caspase-9 [Centrocercus urophasianus]
MAGTGTGLSPAAAASGAPARRHHSDASASGHVTWIAMEEVQRRALRRGRVRLVEGLRPEALWGPLEARGVFTSAMVEDMQSAGTRREQARQLVIDLETRGKQAFPIFLSILRDTGHDDLADMLEDGCGSPISPPVDLRPVQLELPGERRDKMV